MLNLRYKTPDLWVEKATESLAELLADHAHCEQKAAAMAMSLLNQYPNHPKLVHQMALLAEEETLHFRMVIEEIQRRQFSYRKPTTDSYAKALQETIRKGTADMLLDQLLVSALIEARSCERFDLLAQYAEDEGIRTLYSDLFKSEARHYALFIKLALTYYQKEQVKNRLDFLLDREAAIVKSLPVESRMH